MPDTQEPRTVGELVDRLPPISTKEKAMPDNLVQPDQAASPVTAPRYQRRSAEFDKLAAALAKAQGAMENAEKSAENPAFKREGKNSTYATLGSVWDAIRKPLTDNGLSILQWPHTLENGVEIETELLHESGQFMRDVLWLPCPQMTVHSVGSAITYGRRYSLMSIVGIAPEDDDGNGAAEGHKPGAPGSAGGGTDFRAAGPRRQSSWGNGGKPAAVAEAQKDGLIPPPAAKPATNNVELASWLKDNRALISNASTKEELSLWWRHSAEKREDLATAMPGESDKLIELFDDKMDGFKAKVA